MGKIRRQAEAKRAEAQRADGWQNATTGLGDISRDKRLGSNFNLEFLDQTSCELLWRGDDVCARIVEVLPNEMLREGFEVVIEDDEETAELMDEYIREHGLLEQCRRALFYARAYGGAGILLGADDGAKNPENPLDESKIRTFDWVNVLTPKELTPMRWYSDPIAPRYGEVSMYRMNPIYVPPEAPIANYPLVHESRLIRVGGIQTSRWQSLYNRTAPGWDDSAFVRTVQVINDFQHAWQAAALLLQDFSVPTLQMKGLAQLLQAQKANPNGPNVKDRLVAIEMSRSIARAVLIDEGEKYTRESTNLQGFPDMLEKFMSRLAAAVDMPVSLLMGQSPAGLNATGDAEMRWFYDRVAAAQRRYLRPLLRRYLHLCFINKSGPTKGKEPDNWDVRFPSLWQLTDAERADMRLKIAQADQIYLQNGVVLPEEIARDRFGGDAYSMDTHVDLEARAAMQAAQVPAENSPGGPDKNEPPPSSGSQRQGEGPGGSVQKGGYNEVTNPPTLSFPTSIEYGATSKTPSFRNNPPKKGEPE
jgi:uncharacterized protein